MNELLEMVRFFRAVPPVPRLMRTAFVLAVLAGSARLIVDRHGAAAALLPVLTVQVFAASTGFVGPARRGYYDLLFTRGTGRFRIACAHWMASAAPGLAAWSVLVLVEALVTGGRGFAARASGTMTAVALVSTLPWAITVPLPRFSGGIGWVLLFVGSLMLAPPAGGSFAWDTVGSWSGEAGPLAVLLFPFGQVGRETTSGGAVVPALVCAALAMTGAIAWILRADFPLEAAQ